MGAPYFAALQTENHLIGEYGSLPLVQETAIAINLGNYNIWCASLTFRARDLHHLTEKQYQTPFEKLVIKCVDHALAKAFGINFSQVVYYKIVEWYGIRKEEIPNNPDIFSKCLEEMFGLGSKVVEREIIETIDTCFGLEKPSYGLVLAIRRARSKAE